MPVPLPLAVTVVVLTAIVGGLLGAATRRWLAWLRRGAGVPVAWCVAGVGALWAAVASAWVCRSVPGAAVPLLLGLAWLTVAGSAVDLAVRRLPDALTCPAVPVVLALLVPLGGAAVLRGMAGALVLWSVHAVVRRCAPSAMGGGDVRLAASVGAALGGVSWAAIAVGTVLAAVFSTVSGAALRVAAGSAPQVPAAGEVRSGPVSGEASAAVSAGPVSAEAPGSSVSGEMPAGSVSARVPSEPVVGRGYTVPHGPSMLLACLLTVAAAAAWPGAAGAG